MKPYTKDKSMREEVCLYGSTSKEWRILCEVPGDCDHEHSVILAKMGVKKVAEMPKCMKCTIGMLNQPLHCG
ncbi:hypothetical protein KC19_2G040900 [Ceratodon purpureus]|uniref:Uncharacterized protein n=1 Tax=Ceratodon purpureus TaxID=3225 RepID=A0A8T0IS21_CERPU|nr:hypothetical protein KC19_2G040900 [Ceratodon purpureus]